ncbi:KH domain-containing protein [Nanoarchaeota archaeon]
MEFEYELKIPKERIAVLIGKSGEIKRQIEKETKTKLDIDSKEGDIYIKGEDSINLYNSREIIHAIGRGFNPEIALKLLKIDHGIEFIDMQEYAKTKNSMLRLKGRVIGKEGKSRFNIENFTDTDICVYGKTIAIIGTTENIAIAKKAIDSLLTGSPHSSVYKYLEAQKKMRKIGL